MFFTMFSTSLASHIAHSGLDFISVVMDQAKADQQCVSAVLIAVLEHVAKDRSMRKKLVYCVSVIIQQIRVPILSCLVNCVAML